MSVMEPRTYQQRPNRPRSKSGFSFGSDRSVSSTKSPKRETLIETHEEKRKTYLSSTTKANPNAAINEMQPIAAALEEPTMAPLRSGSYNDQYGNPITDPDLSNPTRPRWERPLDTIRSFEAQIDAEFKSRQAFQRADAATNDGYGNTSRRSSSYWGNGGYDTTRQRYSTAAGGGGGGGYYSGYNRDSYVENGNGTYTQPQAAPAGRYRYNARQSSDPTLNRYGNPTAGIYPAPAYQQSRDTVNTGVTGGSGGSGSDPWVSGTDPSSENSSIDKINPAPKQDYDNQYGYQNYGANPTFRNPIMEEGGYGPRGYEGETAGGPVGGTVGGPVGGGGYFSQNSADLPPAPPPKMETARKPIRLNTTPAAIGNGGVLGSTSGNKLQRPMLQKQDSTKRKSWFARRFSKQG